MSMVPVKVERPRGTWQGMLAAAARKVAELVVVFAGVYLAFLLNNYQQHQQERQRRGQVLAWIDQTYSDWYTGLDVEAARTKHNAEEYDAKVVAGEMPLLHAFHYYSDYNPTDISMLLQSGGFDLLDVATIQNLKDVDSLFRQMVGIILHDQQLSDALILPNLEKGPEVFYNPATKQLRPAYEWYGKFYGQQLALYAKLHESLKKLLDQVHAERARNR